MSLTPEQIDRFLQEPIYSWDILTLLSGIVGYLAFSEQNLAWQRQPEVRRAQKETDGLDLQPECADLLSEAREQIVEYAKLRFDIGLSQSVRYGGVVAYVTSIQWCMKLFGARLVHALPEKPRHKNEAVHALEYLNTRITAPLSAQAAELERVITVRNCMVHAAGLVKDYRYEADVRNAVVALNGFSFIGNTVHVAADAVDQMARSALAWVPALDKECSTNGTFK